MAKSIVFIDSVKNQVDSLSVVEFSCGFRKKLTDLQNQGSRLTDARVGFILAWQKNNAPEETVNDPEETAVILPVLSPKQSRISQNLRAEEGMNTR